MKESNCYFYFTLILLLAFWMRDRLLLRWCCKHIGIAEDFDRVVEVTQIRMLVVFMVTLAIVYGIDWSIRDGAAPIMQNVANAITVVLLADTIVMKARGNE